MSSSNYDNSIGNLSKLSWIADAPMFIDETQIEQFFDAIVRPEFEHEGTRKTNGVENSKTVIGNLNLEGEANLPSWLTDLKFIPQLNVKGNARVEVGKTSRDSYDEINHLKPIWNAERQLEELTRQYLINYPSRIFTMDGPIVKARDEADWTLLSNQSSEFPRPLAFLDLPKGTMLIPTAAESTDGGVSLLFKDFAEILTNEDGGPQRNYPKGSGASDLMENKRLYWKSFMEHFESTKAMIVVEEAAKKNGRFEWIDFRVPVGAKGDTLHLHIISRGNYPAGAFGYNFIRRAYNFGVRLVATVKSGPDLNVLAIYEK